MGVLLSQSRFPPLYHARAHATPLKAALGCTALPLHGPSPDSRTLFPHGGWIGVHIWLPYFQAVADDNSAPLTALRTLAMCEGLRYSW
jgi:hypothetical protein